MRGHSSHRSFARQLVEYSYVPLLTIHLQNRRAYAGCEGCALVTLEEGVSVVKAHLLAQLEFSNVINRVKAFISSFVRSPTC